MLAHFRDAHEAVVNRPSSELAVVLDPVTPTTVINGFLVDRVGRDTYLCVRVKPVAGAGPAVLRLWSSVWKMGVRPNTPSPLVGDACLTFTPANDNDNEEGNAEVTWRLPVGPCRSLRARHVFGAMGYRDAERRTVLLEATLTVAWEK